MSTQPEPLPDPPREELPPTVAVEPPRETVEPSPPREATVEAVVLTLPPGWAIEVCPHCHQINKVPVSEWPDANGYGCSRCQTRLPDRAQAARARIISLACTLIALGLIFPAFTQPLLVVEQPGMTIESSLLTGIRKLWDNGDRLVAAVVAVLSGFLPVFKLCALLVLNLLAEWRPKGHVLFRRAAHWALRALHNLLEFTGKWGMTDVFLIALLLLFLRGGGVFHFHAREGIAYFLAMVTFSILAVSFYSRVAHWRNTHDAEA